MCRWRKDTGEFEKKLIEAFHDYDTDLQLVDIDIWDTEDKNQPNIMLVLFLCQLRFPKDSKPWLVLATCHTPNEQRLQSRFAITEDMRMNGDSKSFFEIACKMIVDGAQSLW